MTSHASAVVFRYVSLAVLASVVCGAAACGRRSRPPVATNRTLTAEQVADRAKPGTVWVVVETTATVEVPELSIHEEAFQLSLADRLTPSMSAADLYREMVDLLLKDPERFFVRSAEVRTKSETLYSSGSGLIVTPDGYVATNAHVVKPQDEDVKKVLLESIQEWIESDVTGMEEEIARMLRGASMTEPAKERLIKSLAAYYGSSTTLSEVTTKAFVVTGYTGSSDAPTLNRVPCEILQVGEPAPGKDVAILKMQGSDLPTLSLAKSITAAGIRTGSDIHVMGYPGRATLNREFSMPSRLVPSQTSGKVSAFRDMGSVGDRWQVIETDTTVNHGNSGGPALDDEGTVVGLATFSFVDQPGINYIVAIDVVHEFLRELNVTSSTSNFTKEYLTAVAAYEAGQPGRACSGFKQLQARRAGVRAVDDFVQMLAASGTCPAGDPVVTTPRTARAEDAAQPVRQETGALDVVRTRSEGGSGRRVMVFGFLIGVVGIVLAIVVMANRN